MSSTGSSEPVRIETTPPADATTALTCSTGSSEPVRIETSSVGEQCRPRPQCSTGSSEPVRIEQAEKSYAGFSGLS